LHEGLAVDAIADTELARRAGRGSAEAFAELVGRHERRLFRLALRLSDNNESDAEEIVQEAFLRAYRGIAAFEGHAEVGTWLHRIAVNEVRMRKRASRRRPLQLVGEALAASDVLDVVRDPAPRAEELIDSKGATVRVREAVARLDEPQRTALVLRDIEELPAREVARRLGVTEEVVRQRARRARQTLRAWLGAA
jgi:RNA polymerase sigma-70 factor (ECF subfamily)